MNWEALLKALIPFVVQVADGIASDPTLTEEQKKAYLARIKAAQDSVPEWK